MAGEHGASVRDLSVSAIQDARVAVDCERLYGRDPVTGVGFCTKTDAALDALAEELAELGAVRDVVDKNWPGPPFVRASLRADVGSALLCWKAASERADKAEAEHAALVRRALILAEYCDDVMRCSSHEVRAVAQAVRAQQDAQQEVTPR